MQTKEGKITTKDGLSLYWKGWIPEGKPKAVVHVMHGFAEHINRYMNVVNELVVDGYAIFGNDHRGHGRSEGVKGKRCHLNSFMEYIEDEKQFMEEVVKKEVPGVPYFVLGHSMGSIIATNFMAKYPEGVKGLVLSGTGSMPGPDIGKVTIILLQILSKIIPSIIVKSPLDPNFISRDKDVVKAYIEDPYVFEVLSPRLGEQMNTYLLIGAGKVKDVKTPVLIQIGAEDRSFSGKQELFDNFGSTDKKIYLYEGLRHEVYNELIEDRKKVLSDLHKWLNAHI